MLSARREDEQGIEVIYGAKGSVVEIQGLGDAIRVARLRSQGEGVPALVRTSADEQGCGKGVDCLAERIRKARERVARAQGQELML